MFHDLAMCRGWCLSVHTRWWLGYAGFPTFAFSMNWQCEQVGVYQFTPNGGWAMQDFQIWRFSRKWQCAKADACQSTPNGGWTFQDFQIWHFPMNWQCAKVGAYQFTPNGGWTLQDLTTVHFHGLAMCTGLCLSCTTHCGLDSP